MRTPLCLSRLAVFLLVAISIPSRASADTTVYSNLNSNPADTYASGTFGVSNTLVSGFFQSAAASFTSPGDFQVTQLALAAQFFNGPCCNTPSFNLSLVTSVSGQPGSTVLFSALGVGNEPASSDAGGSCCSLLTVSVAPGVFLNAGQTYWLVAAPANGASTVLWQLNNVGATQAWSLDLGFVEGCQFPNSCLVPDPAGWTTQSGANPAFAVYGNVVTPEPSVTALILLAAAWPALRKLIPAGAPDRS